MGILSRLPLLAAAVFLTACVSSELSRSAAEEGINANLKDASPLSGTFQNTAKPGKYGPTYTRLWEILTGSEGSEVSDYEDKVRLSLVQPGVLEVTLLSHGKAREKRQVPYSLRGQYLFLRHTSEFKWLPLGYASGTRDVAITGMEKGDLVALDRMQAGGVILMGSAGETNHYVYHFTRVAKG